MVNIPPYLNSKRTRSIKHHNFAELNVYIQSKEFKTWVVNFDGNLQESVRLVRGEAVRAETDATVQAVNVLLILPLLLMNYASVEELLSEQNGKPGR
jgi:hypothetical protein